jgi:hypothetical protein
MNTSVQASFSTSVSTNGDYLIIEQKEYEESVGKVTMLDITKALSNLLLPDSSDPSLVDCGMNADGISFFTTVYVYPYPEELIYDTGITHGIASPSGSGIVTETEELNFSLDNKVTLKYPVHLIISTKWIGGDVYLDDGTKTLGPPVTAYGNELSTSKKVYGVLEVVYKTKRDSYNVLITARLTASENVFQSAFYARFDGGVEIMNVEPPPNAEENYANGVNCANADYAGGSNLVIPTDDDDDIPTVEASNIVIGLSYCEDFGHE